MINPLQTTKCGRGIVSVRVALLLRFTEIKPCSFDLFRLYISFDTRHELISLPPLFRFVTISFSASSPASSGAALVERLVRVRLRVWCLCVTLSAWAAWAAWHDVFRCVFGGLQYVFGYCCKAEKRKKKSESF